MERHGGVEISDMLHRQVVRILSSAEPEPEQIVTIRQQKISVCVTERRPDGNSVTRIDIISLLPRLKTALN